MSNCFVGSPLQQAQHQPFSNNGVLAAIQRLVEHLHRRLKDTLRARVVDWCDHLPWAMISICAAYCEDSDFFPSEAVFGSQSQLVLPGQFVDTIESLSLFFLEQLLTTADAPRFLPTPLLYTPTI
jgi:hypothetical protein